MTKDEKLRIARQLERLKVDVIEAGFAASVQRRLRGGARPSPRRSRTRTVCSLARANDRDISPRRRGAEGRDSGRASTPSSRPATLHMEKKLRMTPDQVLEQARLAVRFARNLSDDVEFSPEDGYRSDLDFLCRVLEAVIAEGATTINIPDTVGYAMPELYGNFITTLRERVPELPTRRSGRVHCHNDLGMAVANSLAGVKIGGARQVECTINGLGERAGNCSLEEVVMAVKTRGDYFGLEIGIDTTQIVPASRLVSQITGFVVQPNKAVVGANAFAHASGIHQDGVLKARDTYEIMRAEDVGWAANKIVLGKLSGRNAFKQRLQELGIELESEADVNAAFAALQGTRRPQERNLRRGHHRAGDGRERSHAEQEHYRLARAVAALRDGRAAAGERRRSPSAASSTAPRATATARSTRPSRRSSRRSQAAPKCCSIRSTPSPPAPQNRRAK